MKKIKKVRRLSPAGREAISRAAKRRWRVWRKRNGRRGPVRP
jgi:hypothetical protein